MGLANMGCLQLCAARLAQLYVDEESRSRSHLNLVAASALGTGPLRHPASPAGRFSLIPMFEGMRGPGPLAGSSASPMGSAGSAAVVAAAPIGATPIRKHGTLSARRLKEITIFPPCFDSSPLS